MSKKQSKIGYMCYTAFTWELGEALGGNQIYPSVEDLKENCKCVDECGIIKVKITEVKIVEKGKGWY